MLDEAWSELLKQEVFIARIYETPFDAIWGVDEEAKLVSVYKVGINLDKES